MPRAWRDRVSPLIDNAFLPALILTGFGWVALAQVVESYYLRVGMVLHLVTVIAVAGVLTVAAQLRRTRDEVAGVAHDLRGPLMTVQVTLELLAGGGFGALPEPARAAVLRAAATSARAADLVEHALGRSSAQTGVFPRQGQADLDVVLREALTALEVQVRSAGATVRLGPLPRVAGDSSALFRVFVNLLQNAMKYHRPGAPPLLTVSAEVDEGWALVSVADDGIGIAPSDRLRVFDQRYRAPAGVTQSAGDGLGLATARRLVAGMGGTIWVDGKVERGTAIRLRLPLV